MLYEEKKHSVDVGNNSREIQNGIRFCLCMLQKFRINKRE